MWTDVSSTRSPDTSAHRFRSSLRGLPALVLGITLIFAVAMAVTLVPPVLDCRAQSVGGFLVADSFAGCLGQGVAARFRNLDGRFRQMVLHTGR